MREHFNTKLRLLGFLFAMSDPTINSKTSLKILRQTYTEQVLQTVIPATPIFASATNMANE